jgi:hypothetical protein
MKGTQASKSKYEREKSLELMRRLSGREIHVVSNEDGVDIKL